MKINFPILKTNNSEINSAFRIAVGDLAGNVQPYFGGTHEKARSSILAGLDYDRPWTRDAAINCWNGASLFMPEVAKNTLTSVLTEDEAGKWRVGGQYWDAIIWVTGAWWHYLYTGDQEFLELAFEVTQNTLAYFEQTEFNQENSLFHGAACYGDGVAAYSAEWANLEGQSCILDWPRFNQDKISKPGYGIPMQALSTNCLYYNAYVLGNEMARILKRPQTENWQIQAKRLKAALNEKMWDSKKGQYLYFLSPLANCDHQEGLGHAFAILFNVANRAQRDLILKNQHVTPAGVPCVWPTFERYALDENAFGRHSGTVWPHIQGFWGHAAALSGNTTIFAHELLKLTEFANRDSQFTEIYHPITGEIYGGLQESPQGIRLYKSCRRQTWSATAYIRLILMGLIGMRFDEKGISFNPCLPNGLNSIELKNLTYREKSLSIQVKKTGKSEPKTLLNGSEFSRAFIPVNIREDQEIIIEL